MLRTVQYVFILGALVIALTACSKSSSDTDPSGVPILSDLSSLDPAAAELIREKHDAAAAASTDADARAELAMTYQAHAMNESAVDTYNQALALDAEKPRWWYLLAQAQKITGHDDDAIESIGRSIDLDASYPASHTRRGFWLLEQGLFDEAADSFSGALTANAEFVNARIGYARVDLQIDEAPRAVDTLEAMLLTLPDDPYVKFLLGTAYRQTGRLDEAQTLLDAGTGSQINWRGYDPWTGDMQLLERGYRVDYQRAQDYIAAGRPDLGVALYQELRKDFPTDIAVMTSLAMATAATGQLQPALEILLEALAIDPNHFVVHLDLGTVYLRLKDLQRAEDHTDEAIRLNPSLGQAHFQKGQILFMTNRLPEAEAKLRETIALDPNLAKAHIQLVLTLDRQQKTAECITILNNLIKRFPNLPDSYILLAHLYHATGRLPAAQEIVVVAEKRFPDHPQIQQLRQTLGLR